MESSPFIFTPQKQTRKTIGTTKKGGTGTTTIRKTARTTANAIITTITSKKEGTETTTIKKTDKHKNRNNKRNNNNNNTKSDRK